ncbi:MAG: hypothetical protein U0946_01005 [Patescibacteria group bacterium]|nr:hypothetical protein [Patescibacteria group bacterium]
MGLPRITIGCPYCHGRSKKHGWFRGRRRYFCLSCHRTFGRQKHLTVSFTDFSDFYRLVIGNVNRKQLMEDKAVSRPTLSVAFRPFFSRPLSAAEVWKVLPPKLTTPWVYGVDGKWLKRLGVFILHRNVTTGENLYWSFNLSESYTALITDMAKLVELLSGSLPIAVVSDWKGAIVNAVTAGFGEILHQRCLTHVDRTAKALLPQRSPFEATLELRGIGEQLIKVNSWVEVDTWLKQLAKWYDRYSPMLKERTKNPETKRGWWYTHGDLRRAWWLLTNYQKPFFEHLDCPILPRSNNSLEGTFSQAVNKLINHRGMEIDQQVSFLSWYFTFTRVKNRSDLFKLWAYWKTGNNSV